MKQVLIKKGKAITEEVPAPLIAENEVLVQVHYSAISAGTEVSGVKSSGMPLYQKTLKQPQNIKKVLEMVKSQGLTKTIARVRSKLEKTNSTGYSAAGIVLEIGKNIKDIKQGDRVACAGAGIANHAEFIAVPENLICKVPQDLPLDLASTITLGSIAMQGVRRADPKLGEFIAVIGLGILGQLTAQMLKISGCKVLGIDIDQRRIDLASSAGLDKGLNPNQDNLVEEVLRFSNGYGVDSVILTASAKSSEIINQAMEMCRKKGKVVIVGAIGLNLKREEFYKKEIDLFISTSYGPGRYDEKYEQKGVDYPYAYVRWTEKRNMEEYLHLLSKEKIKAKPLIEKIYPIEEAERAYEELKREGSRPLIILLKYNQTSVPERKIVISEKEISRNRINIGLIGAGGFVKGMHLPNIERMKNLYNLYSIADKIGSNAQATGKEYSVSYTTTDFKEILADKNVDMVIITTRHNLHTPLAIAAAKAGKAIFVEKPMATNETELKELINILEEKKVPFLVGFNRRFSPFAVRIKEIVRDRTNPMLINYRMNAGFIPKEHWVQTDEGKGRNIGEACHIYDLFNFFTESEVEFISASSIEPKTKQYLKNDNFIATIKYKDGSICNLIYTALGSKDYPKEEMEIYVDGKIIHLNDYKELEIFGAKMKGMATKIQNKGHYRELIEFAKSIKEGNGYPIPFWQLVQATQISFEVEKKIM